MTNKASLVGVMDLTDLRKVIPDLVHEPLSNGSTSEKAKRDNTIRAAWAGEAVATFADRTLNGGDGEDWGVCIGDLLTNLMHLADAVGEDFPRLLARARDHYANEVA